MTRIALFALLCAAPVFSQDWYFSNASGMALEPAPSKLTALHAEWALSVEPGKKGDLPELVREYYQDLFSIELRVLYKRGKARQRQWLFRSGRDVTRLNASLPVEAGTDRMPFIELYTEERLLSELYQIDPSGERFLTRYRYENGLLLASETLLEDSVLWRDVYKYTRNSRLRGVERSYAESGETQELWVSIRFPLPGLFISPDSPYEYAFKTGALAEIFSVDAAKVSYTTDESGRVLHEERFDKDGKLFARLSNTWSGDKLESVSWNAGVVSGRTEFEYSASGDRTLEKNYRNGVLERKVVKQGNRETEELYRAGRPVSRTIWEDGRKIGEERF